MRNIVNISLPNIMVREIKNEVKTGGFASVSEFFRHILRERMENKIIYELEKSRKEFAAGKAKPLQSLKDLR